jgi:hypothetical protein
MCGYVEGFGVRGRVTMRAVERRRFRRVCETSNRPRARLRALGGERSSFVVDAGACDAFIGE